MARLFELHMAGPLRGVIRWDRVEKGQCFLIFRDDRLGPPFLKLPILDEIRSHFPDGEAGSPPVPGPGAVTELVLVVRRQQR